MTNFLTRFDPFTNLATLAPMCDNGVLQLTLPKKAPNAGRKLHIS